MVKINFKKKNISESGPLQVEIESLEFSTKKGVKNVENILFCFVGNDREKIKQVLQSKKSDGTEHQLFELEYDDNDLEIETPSASKFASMSARPASYGPAKKTTHKLEESTSTLRIWEPSLVKITVQVDTPKQPKKPTNPSKNDAPKPDSPKAPEPEKVNQQKNTDFSQKPDSTEQEKIDKVKESGNLPAGEINDENRAKIEEIEKKLVDKPEKLREAIQGKIENQLTISGVTEEELPSEAKTSFQQLKNNDITDPTKMREEGGKIIEEIGKLNANKTLTDLENQINEALTNKDEKKAKELKKKISEFINSKNTYFQAEKSKAENLSKKLEDLVRSSSPSQNNPDFPWKIVIPVSLLFVIIIVGTIIVKRNKSKKID